MRWLKRLLEVRRARDERRIADLDDSRLDISERESLVQQTKLVTSLDDNLQAFKKVTGPSRDVAIRRIRLGTRGVAAAVINVEEFADNEQTERLFRSLTTELMAGPFADEPAHKLREAIVNRLLQSFGPVYADTLDDVWRLLMDGYTALLIDGFAEAIGCATEGLTYRAIEEPMTEPAIRGPRDGFTESLGTNISLVRRRLRTPNLWIEYFTIGSLTRTRVGMMYVKGLAHEELIDEVRQRISRIDIDGILESGQVEEFIEDQPLAPFPLTYRTERPDRAVGMLLEGRIAISVDGTPFMLCVPIEFTMLLRAPDDYYERVPMGAFLGFVRYLSFWASIMLPGSYVAALTFHVEIVPTELLLKIVAAREGVPFPIVVEVFLMEFVFEVLREAGLRLPRAVGSAVTIVGALVLGDAATRTGIVSPAVVIIVALTAISSFTTPNFSFSIPARLTRFVFILLGGAFGLFGIQFGFFLIIVILTSLRSFGYPYFSPMGPRILSDFKDVVVRTWWWNMIKRPFFVGSREPIRQRPGQMPRPGLDKEEVEKRKARRQER